MQDSRTITFPQNQRANRHGGICVCCGSLPSQVSNVRAAVYSRQPPAGRESRHGERQRKARRSRPPPPPPRSRAPSDLACSASASGAISNVVKPPRRTLRQLGLVGRRLVRRGVDFLRSLRRPLPLELLGRASAEDVMEQGLGLGAVRWVVLQAVEQLAHSFCDLAIGDQRAAAANVLRRAVARGAGHARGVRGAGGAGPCQIRTSSGEAGAEGMDATGLLCTSTVWWASVYT